MSKERLFKDNLYLQPALGVYSFLTMKRIFVFLLSFSFSTNLLNAQGKEGNTWVLGYPTSSGASLPNFGGSIVQFKNGGIDTTSFTVGGYMSLSTSISDDNGDLQFYSNGCEIYNREYQIMQNGNAISAGESYDLACTGALGIIIYNTFQGIMSFPWPKHEGLFMSVYIFQNEPGVVKNEVHTATIDMSLDNGKGGVTDKNVLAFEGRTSQWYMTATRHGNGQDWWITFPELKTNNYLVFLLDSLGLHGPDVQAVGAFPMGSGGHGQSAFSPDGTKYAEICFFQGQVLDFDRCSGKFSNAQIINYDTIGGNYCAGVAFSPNSRYMYASRCDSIFQFDMSATDFNSTKQAIAQYDSIIDSTGLRGPGFYTLLNGPDDKIYINSASSTKALHVIHHPNEPGIASGFQKWGLELPTLHYGQLPNLPNFRLGAVNPPCTVGTDDAQADAITLFPNPVADYIVVSNQKSDLAGTLTFQLYDALGRLLIDETFDSLPHRIELAGLPKAEYFYRVFSDGGKRLSSGVLVKITTK